MSDIPAHAVAVGTRTCSHPSNTRATCARCGHAIYFRDVTPLSVPRKLCVECLLDEAELSPEPIRVIVTPENVAFARGTLAPPTKGDPQ